jgi:phosphoglycerate dehydrogenase-like enzyme
MPWRAPVLHLFVRAGSGRDELAALLGRAGRAVRDLGDQDTIDAVEVLVVGEPHRARDLAWERAHRLRLVHFLGAGVDGFFPCAGLRDDVVLANARGIHATAMRDHVLAMLLAFARDLPRLWAQQAARRWEPFAAGSLDGKTLAVIGLGQVGGPIARAGAALGMRVLGVRANPRVAADGAGDPAIGGGDANAPWLGGALHEVTGPGELPRVLAAADYVVVAVPLTPATRGLIGPSAIAHVKPGAVLVNVARGGIVDEDALAEALGAGRLRGAAIDVFAREPLDPASPLWTAPNAIVSPHVAGWMPDYLARATAVVLHNVARLQRGEPVRTPVDRARGY